MRISDWSSDVCSSDLRKTVMSSARNFYVIGVTGDPETVGIMEQPRERIDIRCLAGAADPVRRTGRIGHDNLAAIIAIELRGALRQRRLAALQHPVAQRQRSEEHTSELPSLTRISSGVCCLQKKNSKQEYKHM